MGHYSDDPSMVRVDFFKPSGKWYTTEAVKWTGGVRDCLIHDAFKKSLLDHFKDTPERLSDMDAVCFEPYHDNAHPIVLRHGSWRDDDMKSWWPRFKGYMEAGTDNVVKANYEQSRPSVGDLLVFHFAGATETGRVCAVIGNSTVRVVKDYKGPYGSARKLIVPRMDWVRCERYVEWPEGTHPNEEQWKKALAAEGFTPRLRPELEDSDDVREGREGRG